VIYASLLELKSRFYNARNNLRIIGELSLQPIEPTQQTELLNATEDIAGVLCSGVPGAGGVDAVFAIVLSHEARDRVEKLWSTWDGTQGRPSVCALPLSAESKLKVGIWLEEP
jgi:phosphomevalonate kinase